MLNAAAFPIHVIPFTAHPHVSSPRSNAGWHLTSLIYIRFENKNCATVTYHRYTSLGRERKRVLQYVMR
jgi:hypothetical protein